MFLTNIPLGRYIFDEARDQPHTRLKIVMFNVIVVVSIEFRKTRLEKSCNLI